MLKVATLYIFAGAVFLAFLGGLVGIILLVGDVKDELPPKPEVQCLQGVFLEELQPQVEQFGAFTGYLCGTNLQYVFGIPKGEVLNSGNIEVPFN